MPDVILLEELDGFTVEPDGDDGVILECGECGAVVTVSSERLGDLVARARNHRVSVHA